MFTRSQSTSPSSTAYINLTDPQELQELRHLKGDPEMKELVRAEEQQCLREIEELEVRAVSERN